DEGRRVSPRDPEGFTRSSFAWAAAAAPILWRYERAFDLESMTWHAPVAAADTRRDGGAGPTLTTSCSQSRVHLGTAHGADGPSSTPWAARRPVARASSRFGEPSAGTAIALASSHDIRISQHPPEGWVGGTPRRGARLDCGRRVHEPGGRRHRGRWLR